MMWMASASSRCRWVRCTVSFIVWVAPGSPGRASEVTFLFLLLHRRRLVVVDHAALALGARGEQHLLDDRGQRVGLALDRAGERVAAERAETDLLHHRFLA